MPSVATPHTRDAIVNTPTPERKAAERQHVGGDDPALACVGKVELGLQPRQRDDDDGAVERRHQLHAGDREYRDA
jgi:hypothetical protein